MLPLGLSYNQFPNGTLLISSVDKSAQGSYTCTAQNGVRAAITKTINVTVNGKGVSFLFASFKGAGRFLRPPSSCHTTQRVNFAEKVHKPPPVVNVINFELNGFNASIWSLVVPQTPQKWDALILVFKFI